MTYWIQNQVTPVLLCDHPHFVPFEFYLTSAALSESSHTHTHTHTLTWISLTLTDTTSPLGLCVQRSPIRLCPPWFFSASFALVTHLSARYLAFPLSRRQVLEMSDGVICHKCPKHAWSERYHPRWNACSPRVLTDVLGARFSISL